MLRIGQIEPTRGHYLLAHLGEIVESEETRVAQQQYKGKENGK